MWDDDENKTMARGQTIAIVAMTALVIVWFQFFMPSTPPAQRRQAPVQRQEETGKNAPSPAPSQTEQQAGNAPSDQWPFLPPVAAQENPVEDEVVLESPDLRLVFTRVGARLKQAYVKLHNYGESQIQLVPAPMHPADPNAPSATDADVMYPLGLHFTDQVIGDELDRRRFEATHDEAHNAVVFTLTLLNAARITKTFSLSDLHHVLEVQVDYENLEPPGSARAFGVDQTPAFWLNWGPDVDSQDKLLGVQPSFMWRKEGKNSIEYVASLKTDDPKREIGAEWIAYKSAYFVVAMKSEFAEAQSWLEGTPNRFRFGLAAPRFSVEPGAVQSHRFRLYAGPSQQDYLAAAWDTLPTTVRFFSPTYDWMDKFAKLLLAILNWFYGIIPNYGIAIVLLTVLVRVGMFPLTLKSMKSMKRMQMLAPEMAELKAKYGQDPQELNKKMMELYRERGVNPVGGCLPMLLQMPVFIALYRMLWSTYELRGAPFAVVHFGDYSWIKDLAQPDQLLHLPFMQHIPLIGSTFTYLNVLPILMAVAMVVSQKLMPASGPVQNDQQKMIMNIMPVFFSFICYNMASGLNLYILTSTVLGIAQSKLMPMSKIEASAKKQAPRKKQHFYTAALERKRRLAKEMKEDKKRARSARGKASASDRE